MTAAECSPIELSDLNIRELHGKDSMATLTRLRSIEKKSFPANEAFDFNISLLTRKNTSIIYAVFGQNSKQHPVAYAVYVRWRSVLLLQKLCVAESFRRKGIGRLLMREVINRARSTKCGAIELWVDTSRIVARGLYSIYSFQEIQFVQDYYALGRHGIKMRLDLPP